MSEAPDWTADDGPCTRQRADAQNLRTAQELEESRPPDPVDTHTTTDDTAQDARVMQSFAADRRVVHIAEFQSHRVTTPAERSYDVDEVIRATSSPEDIVKNEQSWYNDARLVFEILYDYIQLPDIREAYRHKAQTLDELFGDIVKQLESSRGLRFKNADALIKAACHMSSRVSLPEP